MAFIRAKTISGNQYFYLVESRREGRRVTQRVLKYLGKSMPSFGAAATRKTVVPKNSALNVVPKTGALGVVPKSSARSVQKTQKPAKPLGVKRRK